MSKLFYLGFIATFFQIVSGILQLIFHENYFFYLNILFFSVAITSFLINMCGSEK